jgi:NADH pyrophosphatase NudC (nudix superfamily)
MEEMSAMDEQFRRVGTLDIQPFEIWVKDGDQIYFDDKPMDSRVALTVAKARALRDWLTQALPCPHDGSKTGFGDTSGRMRETCDKCGAVTIDFPGSGDVK